MSDSPVNLSGGIPETVLDPVDEDLAARLDAAAAAPAEQRRDALAALVSAAPRQPVVWAVVGDEGRDVLERYAAYRVGYHRGLDALRGSGWRGSGYVRWEHPGNRGFLRCLVGLRDMAAAIGEADEVERCSHFLAQLDPREFPLQ